VNRRLNRLFLSRKARCGLKKIMEGNYVGEINEIWEGDKDITITIIPKKPREDLRRSDCSAPHFNFLHAMPVKYIKESFAPAVVQLSSVDIPSSMNSQCRRQSRMAFLLQLLEAFLPERMLFS
jgi:hypothetical protein